MGTLPPPVPNRRDRKKQQTRAALIAAALRLVDERGLDRVTVEEISEAVDVSPRTFFNYFATKDDAIIGEAPGDRPTLSELLSAVPPEVPLVAALLQAVDPVVEGIQAERDLWLLRMRVIKDNPSLLPTLVARGAIEEEQATVAIAARIGLPADDFLPQLAAALTGAAFRTAMMRWATTDGGTGLRDLLHEAFGVLAVGLRHPQKGDR